MHYPTIYLHYQLVIGVLRMNNINYDKKDNKKMSGIFTSKKYI
jgi:hypothetical protein